MKRLVLFLVLLFPIKPVLFSNPVSIDFSNKPASAIKFDTVYKSSQNQRNVEKLFLERHRLWINLANTEGAFKQILIGYVEGATNSWDNNFDGVTLDGNKYLDFYSINGDKKLIVQGRALPFADSDFIPLGYKSAIKGDFYISIDRADGNLTNQPVYLEDKETGVLYDLRASDYNFSTEIGTFTDRFILRYTNKTLGTDDVQNSNNTIYASVNSKIIKLTSTKETISKVSIFDLSGKLLYDNSKIESAELQIADIHSDNQVLLVKVTLENGNITTKKIVF